MKRRPRPVCLFVWKPCKCAHDQWPPPSSLTSDHLSLKDHTCCTFGMILKLFIAFFSWAAVVSTATETGSRHHGNKSSLTPTRCHSHVAVEMQRHVQTAICLCRPMPHICLSSLMYVWHWGWGGCREVDYVQPYSLHWLVPVQCNLCCLSCLGGHIFFYIHCLELTTGTCIHTLW